MNYFLREGTLAPFLRALESPIAIACLRDVTFFPERPETAVPFFILRISFFTSVCAEGLYLREDKAFLWDADFLREECECVFLAEDEDLLAADFLAIDLLVVDFLVVDFLAIDLLAVDLFVVRLVVRLLVAFFEVRFLRAITILFFI